MNNPIHVTTLTSFLACPYKWKNDVYSPDIAKTYPGDMLNVAANSNGPVEKYIEWYGKNFSVDFKQIEIMKKAYASTKLYIEGLKNGNNVYQEAKHYVARGDEMIVGSADLVIVPHIWHKDTEDTVFIKVEDLKFSTHKYYMDPQRFVNDAQSFIYPLQIMNLYDTNFIEFSFVCRDNKLGTMQKNTIVRTRDECQAYLDNTMTKYLESDMLGEYPRCHNTFCEGCPFKIGCPERFAKK